MKALDLINELNVAKESNEDVIVQAYVNGVYFNLEPHSVVKEDGKIKICCISND